jgi:hypothetical protein
VRAVNAELENPPRHGRSFRIVSLVFVGLLAIGLSLGFVVYKKYVAYSPHVSAHVPADATLAVRVDLTHVMLYEPFRRWIFPLADRFGGAASPRHERLDARSLRINEGVRELLFVSGPAPADWALVIGGRFPRGLIGAGVAAALREEGRQVRDENDGSYTLPGSGLAFAEATGGALALASSRERLQRVLPAGERNPVLSAGAGGLIVRGGALPEPFRGLTATFLAGSVVEIRGHADVPASVKANEATLRALIQGLGSGNAASASALSGLELTSDDSGISFRVGLSREAVLGLTELLSQRIPG